MTRFREVVVFGAGAIGSYLGARLSLPTTLVGRRAHVDAINEQGLRISGRDDEVRQVAATTECPEFGPATLLLVGVKLGDLVAAAAELRPRLHDDTVVVTLANGLEPDRVLADGLDRPVHRVIVQLGVTLDAPGEVRSYGGSLLLGPGEVEDQLATLFEEAHFPVARCENLRLTSWRKLALNCVVNPLSALTGRRNRELITPELRPLRQLVVDEVRRLAAAEGVDLPADLCDHIDTVMSKSMNQTSMLQDVQRGRKTEIDYLNGWVVDRARHHGFETPINQALTELILLLASSP